MGSYVNPRPDKFERSIRSQIYVDKTGLTARTNALLGTQDNCLCVSRPRRFGKTMGLDMLSAYYASGQDSRALFEGFEIADDPSFEAHLNAYDVVQLNMQEFLSASGHDMDRLMGRIAQFVARNSSRATPTRRSSTETTSFKSCGTSTPTQAVPSSSSSTSGTACSASSRTTSSHRGPTWTSCAHG